MPDPLPVLLLLLGESGRFDVDGEPLRLEFVGQPSGGADQVFAVGAATGADQEPFGHRPGAGDGAGCHVGPHLVVHSGGGSAQSQFPQGDQVAGPEELADRLRGLLGNIHLALTQSLQQGLGRNIHQHDLSRLIKEAVWHGFPHRDRGDLGDDVAGALEVLDIDSGVHVNAGGQQFLDILPAFFVAASGRIGVGQLVDQGQLGLARQDSVDVEFRKFHPLVEIVGLGQDFHPFQQSVGFRPTVGLDISGHHINAFGLALPGRLQHGVGLANPGGVAEKDGQSTAPVLDLFGLRHPEHGFRRGTSVIR